MEGKRKKERHANNSQIRAKIDTSVTDKTGLKIKAVTRDKVIYPNKRDDPPEDVTITNKYKPNQSPKTDTPEERSRQLVMREGDSNVMLWIMDSARENKQGKIKL